MIRRQHFDRALRAVKFLRLRGKYRDVTMTLPNYFGAVCKNGMRGITSECDIECGEWRDSLFSGMYETLPIDNQQTETLSQNIIRHLCDHLD